MRAPRTRILFWQAWRMALVLLLLAAAPGFAQAQSDDDQGAAGDPPARVARLAYESGDLGLMPAGSTQWGAADINRPLTNGDKLSSGPGARAELELGGASLRIDGQTDIGLLNLSEQIGQFELTQGTLNLAVRNLDQGSSYEIDTPTLALVIDRPGTYRVDVPGDGSSTTVTVFSGTAQVYGENQAQREVFAGRSYQFLDSTLNNSMVSDISGRDAFDAWCSERDAMYANAGGSAYVSNDVVGAQDLNQYGNWQVDEEYGPVWYPVNVVVGWAPYRFGHWVWIGPWGWTWVDDLPWGFAPYHYGRWVFIRGAWGWIPCPRYARPIYAPALVAFVGLGHGGPVGWFPLGPREVYNPWYRASRGYYTNVNITNIYVRNTISRTTVVNNINQQYAYYRSGRTDPRIAYANRAMPHAMTTVSAQAFTSAARVQNHQVRTDPHQLAGATVLAGAALQRPIAASFAPPRNTNARPLPAAGFNRQVMARTAPPAPIHPMLPGMRPPTSNIRVFGTARAVMPHPVAPANVPTRTQPPQAPVNHAGALPAENFVRHAPPAESPVNRPLPPHPPISNGNALPSEGFVRHVPPVEAPASRPVEPASRPTLPQVPQFRSAQQIRPVEPPAPRPPPQPYVEQQQRYVPQQQRFQAAEQAHSFVPSQRMPEPAPFRGLPYAPQQQLPYAHPGQIAPHYQPPPHAQPHQNAAPQSKRDDNGQH